MGWLYFLVLNLLGIASVIFLTRLLLSEWPFLLQLLAGSVLFPVLILWMVLTLGSFGFLSAPNAVIFIVLIFSGAMAVWACQKSKSDFFPLPWPLPYGPFLKGGLGLILGLAAGLLAGRFVFQGTHFVIDDLSYHATAPAHWLSNRLSIDRPLQLLIHLPL